jgi:hypothetical protein
MSFIETGVTEMTKVHLIANKLTGQNAAFALCASRSLGKGKVVHNSRETYRYMASEIVSLNDFLTKPVDVLCAHCLDKGLIRRNLHRRLAGKPPVENFFQDRSPR